MTSPRHADPAALETVRAWFVGGPLAETVLDLAAPAPEVQYREPDGGAYVRDRDRPVYRWHVPAPPRPLAVVVVVPAADEFEIRPADPGEVAHLRPGPSRPRPRTRRR